MGTQAPNWYKEKIRADVINRNKVRGGLLDDTMTRGDGGAGEVKYPVFSGSVNVYELSGSIQKIKASNANLQMIPVAVRDFEAAAWMRVQDARKQGANEQSAVGRQLSDAIRFKRDELKLEALYKFSEATSELLDGPTKVQTIGDGTTVIDLPDVLEAGSGIAGTGSDEDIFFPLPETWMNQLCLYKEFANADWTGGDLPFASMTRVKKKTWQGIHFFTLPNKYFFFGTGKFREGENKAFDEAGYLDTFMWTKDAMGAEAEWDQENMSLSSHEEFEGTPMLGKVGLSGNAVGLLPEGVKRLRFKAQNRVVRPAAA
ncbi:phage capsid protein [Pseudovibrio sp. POLY-S9]|uniref:phage capsid protein n=1 Tax=Pseudovibrio sp. POLY-S9 TaxID=1576596 RepID=UPI00070AEA87|nr:phage capsid protein [Pseudovibrio sp. POLY-S9]